MNTTQKEAQDVRTYIETYERGLEALQSIKNALATWTYKTVDKRFNKKYFTENNGYRDYYKYELRPPVYSFEHGYRVYLAKDCELKLESRDTAHVRERVDATIKQYEQTITEYKAEAETLEAFDEEALIKALRDVRDSLKVPARVWRKVLDSYEVKYND